MNKSLKTQENQGETIAPSLQVGDFIDRFISSYDAKESTKLDYRKALKGFEYWLKLSGTDSPQKEDILEYRTALIERGLAPLSVSAYVMPVRRFFSYLESVKAYPNVAKDIKGMRQPQDYLKDPLTEAQVKMLLSINDDSLIGKRNYAIINLMVRTAIRTIEVVRADVGDIGMKSGSLVLKVWGKGRDTKDDFVLLTDECYVPLMKYLTARGNKQDHEPLFVSHSHKTHGDRLTTRTIRRLVSDKMNEQGFKTKRLSAHSLRHTAATIALKNGADIVNVKDMLRHQDLNTTMRYSRNVNRVKNGAEKKVTFSFDTPAITT